MRSAALLAIGESSQSLSVLPRWTVQLTDDIAERQRKESFVFDVSTSRDTELAEQIAKNRL
jgi:hypothetical protein